MQLGDFQLQPHFACGAGPRRILRASCSMGIYLTYADVGIPSTFRAIGQAYAAKAVNGADFLGKIPCWKRSPARSMSCSTCIVGSPPGNSSCSF